MLDLTLVDGAATARSLLAFPHDFAVSLGAEPVTTVVGMDDTDGVPVFMCAPDSALPRAAAGREVAHVNVRSGWPRAGSGATLDLSGRLRPRGETVCECCGVRHPVVALEPAAVLLSTGGRRTPVPLEDYLSPTHDLSAGYLARVVHHANRCHADQLRLTAARRSGQRESGVAAAEVVEVTQARLRLAFVDVTGAHEGSLRLGETATDRDHLARLLREELGPDLC